MPAVTGIGPAIVPVRGAIVAAVEPSTPETVVMTVRGPVLPGDLGMTLSHDHVLLDGWAIFATYAVIIDDEELAAAELRLYRDAGGGAVCDPTNVGLGRDPEALRRVSEASGVHIVMGAGWYRERVYPTDLDVRSTDDLADQLVRELTIGVGRDRGSGPASSARSGPNAARSRRWRNGCSVLRRAPTDAPDAR